MEIGIIPKSDSGYLAVKYYAPFIFLLKDGYSAENYRKNKKISFRNAAYQHIEKFFAEMEVA